MNPKQFAVIVEDGWLVPFNFVTEDFIKDNYKDGQHLILESVDVTGEKARTAAQNNAIHLYISQVTKALCEQGVTVREVLEATNVKAELTPTSPLMKEVLWRRMQVALCDVKSTTSLEKQQVSEIYENISRFLTRYDISIPFPERRM